MRYAEMLLLTAFTTARFGLDSGDGLCLLKMKRGAGGAHGHRGFGQPLQDVQVETAVIISRITKRFGGESFRVFEAGFCFLGKFRGSKNRLW